MWGRVTMHLGEGAAVGGSSLRGNVQMRPDLQEGANNESRGGAGESRLLGMNRKGPQEAISLT